MNVNNKIFFALVEEQLKEGQNVRMSLKGTSMLPTLCADDVLTLKPVAGPVQVGDVVLFRYCGRHIVHRVIACEGDNYTIQGDNCYSTEEVRGSDIIARVVQVEKRGGARLTTDGDEWLRLSRRSLRRKKVKNFVLRWLGRDGRRKLRPWYFVALAILMWAPLNGFDLQLSRYVFGLRADHLLHASVYIPCSLFLMDLFKRNWFVWVCAVGVGLFTEGVQWFLPYRGYDVNDLVANVIGVTLGWAVITLYRRVIRRRRQYPDRAMRGVCR